MTLRLVDKWDKVFKKAIKLITKKYLLKTTSG